MHIAGAICREGMYGDPVGHMYISHVKYSRVMVKFITIYCSLCDLSNQFLTSHSNKSPLTCPVLHNSREELGACSIHF